MRHSLSRELHGRHFKGAAGGEKIPVRARGSAESPLTLTNAWAQYAIPTTVAVYNTCASGVEHGFY